jgi:Holliday junction resolvase RusA-like endonuclease
MRVIHNPKYEIWIQGKPKSFRKNLKSSKRYRKAIQDSAKAIIEKPLRSRRIDIEIFFAAPYFQRTDVDNVIKPILDAFQGVVYLDDSQVRSVKVMALPSDDAYRLSGSEYRYKRITKDKPKEFLVKVFEGLRIKGEL